jgi:hypothetical protein
MISEKAFADVVNGDYERRECLNDNRTFYAHISSPQKYCCSKCKSQAFYARRKAWEAEFQNEGVTSTSTNEIKNEDMDNANLEKLLALNNELNEAKTQVLLKNQEIERLQPLADKYEKEAGTLRYRLQSTSNLAEEKDQLVIKREAELDRVTFESNKKIEKLQEELDTANEELAQTNEKMEALADDMDHIEKVQTQDYTKWKSEENHAMERILALRVQVKELLLCLLIDSSKENKRLSDYPELKMQFSLFKKNFPEMYLDETHERNVLGRWTLKHEKNSPIVIVRPLIATKKT